MLGCSDKTSDSSEATTEASSEPSSSEPSESSEPSSSEPSEPGTSETDCGDLAQQDCVNCFAEQYPVGAQAYNDHLFEHCICANECETDCADTCADPTNVTQECNTCINTVGADQNSGCVQGFGAACQADSDCMDFYMATQECL